jgi:FkbM family methyltransferase
MKRIIRSTLRGLGYDVRRARDDSSIPDMNGGLARAALRRLKVATFIDVGASSGIWTIMAMRHFPGAEYTLVEAQSIHEPALKRLAKHCSNVRYQIAAASNHVGSIYFDAPAPFAGRAIPTPVGDHVIEVPATTVDAVVLEYGLRPPFCLKLDTHGFEVPILEGAKSTLLNTNLVVMECYNFRLPGALLFHEMCRHMGALGFRCIDLVDQMYRPGDLAFWQADLFFARDSDPVFELNEYV